MTSSVGGIRLQRANHVALRGTHLLKHLVTSTLSSDASVVGPPLERTRRPRFCEAYREVRVVPRSALPGGIVESRSQALKEVSEIYGQVVR